MVSVKVVDEAVCGDRDTGWLFEVDEERLPLREIIRQRVFQEVAAHNAAAVDTVFRGLVRPTDAVPVRGGFRTTALVDPESQCEAAWEAFGRNGFVVLIGDRQIEELDEVVALTSGVEITFLKLVALVGG
ncbi:hypothetical protein D5S18_17990 [Nocardia panacis]|uniref:Uncharacterized protein n=2 Tax=Nocardia panacis TaxID=2340916 RepID=A0A3A4K862_9NOCA|nr:hypothetical protein D5S18_17990 [Nocardia panacis]